MDKIITVKGAVQGVGYRPFISELATEYGLSGSVRNIGAAVDIYVSGAEEAIASFVNSIRTTWPAGALILSVEEKEIPNGRTQQALPTNGAGMDSFRIVDSADVDLSAELPVFLPDIGICPDCMKEMLDPDNKRFRYPLISCAVCGPRMSILQSLPYDRVTTTMSDFDMCPSCREDYVKIKGRRNFAQTISCHDCGPQMMLSLTESLREGPVAQGEDAVSQATEILKNNGIIGLKGISGYQLVCKPLPETAKRLRTVKGRENKPFALMFSDIDDIKKYAYVSTKEEELLVSSARPIVLLNSKTPCTFPDEVLKGSRYIGAFLPSAGIHRLLTDAVGPLIVTSANKSDEPMTIDDEAFVETFMDQQGEVGAAALEAVDAVLYHKRKILMPQDDSVMFVVNINGQEYPQFIRRARGFAPLPIIMDKSPVSPSKSPSVLALGGDLKSSFALGKNERILPSQYIGDLGNVKNLFVYDALLYDYRRIFEFQPDFIVKDLHPAYKTTVVAKELGKEEALKHINLQHHFAHIYSVMAENSLKEAIGISFDGTGYGNDDNIWGGEFLHVKETKQSRLGHLSYIKLTGGDNAPKDCNLVSLCYLNEALTRGLISSRDSLDYLKAQEGAGLDSQKQAILKAALLQNINTYNTSSVGRLFDAVSSILGICSYNTYEGEAAIMLEKAALEFYDENIEKDSRDLPEDLYPSLFIELKETRDGFICDQTALFADIFKLRTNDAYGVQEIAYGFHMALKDMMVRAAVMMRDKTKINDLCLSGGCFNNRLLLTSSVKALTDLGFKVYWNMQVPLGDGGLSTGQAYFGLLYESH